MRDKIIGIVCAVDESCGQDGPPDCEFCDGLGYYERTIGGDGYGDKCCGTMDVEIECEDCDGTGKEQPHDKPKPS